MSPSRQNKVSPVRATRRRIRNRALNTMVSRALQGHGSAVSTDAEVLNCALSGIGTHQSLTIDRGNLEVLQVHVHRPGCGRVIPGGTADTETISRRIRARRHHPTHRNRAGFSRLYDRRSVAALQGIRIQALTFESDRFAGAGRAARRHHRREASCAGNDIHPRCWQIQTEMRNIHWRGVGARNGSVTAAIGTYSGLCAVAFAAAVTVIVAWVSPNGKDEKLAGLAVQVKPAGSPG